MLRPNRRIGQEREKRRIGVDSYPQLKGRLTVYPTARLGADQRGLVLRNSPPPILKRQVLLQGSNGISIPILASKKPA